MSREQQESEREAESFSGWDADEVARYPRMAAEVIERLRSRLLDEFRRSEVPEPSAEQMKAYRRLAELAHEALTLPRGRLETTKKLAGLALPLSVALDHFLTTEPQAEPSDAEVRAAQDAMSRWVIVPESQVRAALRAASAVTEQGESRG